MSHKPPRDPRSQIHIPEKLAHIDPSQNNIDLMNYENEVNQNRGNRSSSLSKLGEQNYKQMLDYPESNYHHQQDQIQYEEPININENQFHGFEDEELAFREEIARQEHFKTIGTPSRSRPELGQYHSSNKVDQLPLISQKNYSSSLDRLQNQIATSEDLTAAKIPILNFDFRKVKSQGVPDSLGFNLNGSNNPITHNQMLPASFTNSGNLWYHQREEKDVARRRQKMLCDALNEQRRLEKQRKEIDKQFETLQNYKVQAAMSEKMAREDQVREGYRKRLEDASKLNDVRLGYYLNNYYLPPEEKDLRASNSERIKSGSGNRKKIIMMKKRRVGE